MTSTSFNIGFIEGKNSSRVLKPPGGGHSDIFGIRSDNDIQNQVKRKNHPPTTITSCFVHEECIKPGNNNKDELKKEDIENGNQNWTKTDVSVENTEPTKENKMNSEEEQLTENKTPAPPKRVRVPPGGFSSGLW